jgi:hypothetical protein
MGTGKHLVEIYGKARRKASLKNDGKSLKIPANLFENIDFSNKT